MTAAPIDPGAAETRCCDGIDLVELYGADRDALDLATAYDVEGVVLYAQLLEATLMVVHSAAGKPTTPENIRAAARESAGAWRRR